MIIKCPYCQQLLRVSETPNHRLVPKPASIAQNETTSYTNLVEEKQRAKAIKEFVDKPRSYGPHIGFSNLEAMTDRNKIFGADAERVKNQQRQAGFV